MVMRVGQAAAYLGVHVDTMYRYANDAVVPAFRIGRSWRFRRDELDEWMKREGRKGLVKRG